MTPEQLSQAALVTSFDAHPAGTISKAERQEDVRCRKALIAALNERETSGHSNA